VHACLHCSFLHVTIISPLTELLPVFHQVHLLTSSMVHFIGQMQYYITFEVFTHHKHVVIVKSICSTCYWLSHDNTVHAQQVLECCWADLLQDIGSAPDLDHLITTHSSFLRLITTRCLLDPNSQVIYCIYCCTIIQKHQFDNC